MACHLKNKSKKKHQRLINELTALSPHEQMNILELVLDTQLEYDNYGQIIIYTGYTVDDKGDVRVMDDEDFEG